jgi:hypothetical protein
VPKSAGHDLAVDEQAARLKVQVGQRPAVAVDLGSCRLVGKADALPVDQPPQERRGLVSEPLDGLAWVDRLGSIDADQPDLDGPAVEADDDGIAVDDARDQSDGGRSRAAGLLLRQSDCAGQDGAERQDDHGD